MMSFVMKQIVKKLANLPLEAKTSCYFHAVSLSSTDFNCIDVKNCH